MGTSTSFAVTVLHLTIYTINSIISITTYTAIVVDPSKSAHKLREDRKRSSSGSWFSFMLKLFLFVGVCVGAFYGYQVYTREGASFPSFNTGQASFGTNIFNNGKRFWWSIWCTTWNARRIDEKRLHGENLLLLQCNYIPYYITSINYSIAVQ